MIKTVSEEEKIIIKKLSHDILKVVWKLTMENPESCTTRVMFAALYCVGDNLNQVFDSGRTTLFEFEKLQHN